MMFDGLGRSVIRSYCGARSAFLGGAVTRGPKSQKIALTFDDGPSEPWTADICSILEERGARASFFMLGSNVEKHPGVAKRLAEAGHEPCAHLYSHDRTAADDDDVFSGELARTIAAIEKSTGARPAFLRFPFAHMGRQKPASTKEKFGLTTVHWSFSSLDSRSEANQIAARVARYMFPGAIVLLHDGVGAFSKFSSTRDATVEALPKILAACRERGFKAVTLSELLD